MFRFFKNPIGRTMFAGVLSLMTFVGVRAQAATYCDSKYPLVHSSGNLHWCVDPNFWASNQASITPFFSYVDQLLDTLAEDFGIDSSSDFYVVVNQPNGYASTPTPYGPGINITGDAFYNTAYGIKGFYGYLLITHEFVNQWTGLMTNGGWPTDWWADHRSPFPNSMDAYILAQLGQTKAAAAQTSRFVAGGDSADTMVVMFNNFFSTYGGFAWVQRLTALLQGDGMTWGSLKDPPNYTTSTTFVSGNPSELRSSYVGAYLSLAAKADLTTALNNAGVGTKPPNWSSSDTFTTYSLNSTTLTNIANAHCSLAAAANQNQNVSTLKAQYLKGNYAAVNTAFASTYNNCGYGCPTECGCSTSGQCVAKWKSVGSPISLQQNSNYKFDIANFSMNDGATLQIWSANEGTNQRFSFVNGQLIGLGNKCLMAQSAASKSPVVTATCNQSALQKWTLDNNALKLQDTNFCIDVPSSNFGDGKMLWIYTCNNTSAQKWVAPANQAPVAIKSKGNTGLCVDVSKSGTTDGTTIQLWTCNGTGAQTWTIGGGRISALGKCLAARNVSSGSAVQLFDCSTVTSQNWFQNGSALQLVGTSLCLDVPKSNFASEQALQLYTCNGTNAQNFVN